MNSNDTGIVDGDEEDGKKAMQLSTTYKQIISVFMSMLKSHEKHDKQSLLSLHMKTKVVQYEHSDIPGSQLLFQHS